MKYVECDIKQAAHDDEITVMAFGTFDILHPGHEYFLKQARQLGQRLIVVLARDKIIPKIKGRPPRNDEKARLQAVRDLPFVDIAVLGSLTDMYQRIGEFRPDIIALGYDQTAFTDGLGGKLNEIGMTDTKIVRIKAHKPEIYKSSLFRR